MLAAVADRRSFGADDADVVWGGLDIGVGEGALASGVESASGVSVCSVAGHGARDRGRRQTCARAQSSGCVRVREVGKAKHQRRSHQKKGQEIAVDEAWECCICQGERDQIHWMLGFLPRAQLDDSRGEASS